MISHDKNDDLENDSPRLKGVRKLKFQPESFRGVNCSFWPTSFFGGILKTITLRNSNLHIKVIESIQHHSKVMKKLQPKQNAQFVAEIPCKIYPYNLAAKLSLHLMAGQPTPPPSHVRPPNNTALLRAY